MASWTELTDYVRSNYKIADERPNMLKMANLDINEFERPLGLVTTTARRRRPA